MNAFARVAAGPTHAEPATAPHQLRDDSTYLHRHAGFPLTTRCSLNSEVHPR